MNLRLISLTVATALALAPAGKAADGNITTGSVGTAQASSVSSEPVVEINAPVAQVTVQAPVSLPGAGGNEATDSFFKRCSKPLIVPWRESAACRRLTTPAFTRHIVLLDG